MAVFHSLIFTERRIKKIYVQKVECHDIEGGMLISFERKLRAYREL